MVGHYRTAAQPGELDDLLDTHDDVAAQIETRAACRHHADGRLVLAHAGANGIGEQRVARQIQARFSRHLDQITDSVLHQAPDQSAAMGAANGAYTSAKEGNG